LDFIAKKIDLKEQENRTKNNDFWLVFNSNYIVQKSSEIFIFYVYFVALNLLILTHQLKIVFLLRGPRYFTFRDMLSDYQYLRPKL
jgi:hypothetical protein